MSLAVSGTFLPVHVVVWNVASIEYDRDDDYIAWTTVKNFSTEQEALSVVLRELREQMDRQIPDAIGGWAAEEGESDEEEDDEEGEDSDDESSKDDLPSCVGFYEHLSRERPSAAFEVLKHRLAMMLSGDVPTWDKLQSLLADLSKLLQFILDVCINGGVSGSWPEYGIMEIVSHDVYYKPVKLDNE